MKKTFLTTLAILAIALGGCSEKSANYAEALHRSWTDIRHAVQEDGSLRQIDLNIGSGLAVTLAEAEASHWTAVLQEEGLAAPEWQERLEEIADATCEFEGGSAAPLSKHLAMLACLDGAIEEMRATFRAKR